MLAHAAGLAFLAALSPTALLVAAVYLGSVSPRRTALLYLAGAVAMTIVLAVVVFLALHAGGLNQRSQRTPRYGLRLGLGAAALAAGVWTARRRPRRSEPGRQGGIWRMVASPAPVAAFAVGMFVFAPSLSFIAAVQVIATAHADIGSVVLAIAVIVVIDVMFAWIPLVCHLVAPEATSRRLSAFNTWLRAHGKTLLAGGLIVAGAWLIVDGASGLLG